MFRPSETRGAGFLELKGIKMKKLKYLFLLLFLSVPYILFAQAQVTTAITVTDGFATKELHFGLDSTATDGIDVHLDEGYLPPLPPQGAFDARFYLPENNFNGTAGSWKDFRFANFPSFDTLEHRIKYQRGLGTVIIISWDFPPDVSGLLQDMFGGIIINVPVSDSGSYTVTNPDALDRLKFVAYYDGSVPVELVSFSASISGPSIVLNWKTASEINNYGFEIQRKSQNSDWKKIGFVNGAGTTSDSKSYTFTDVEIESGLYSYRLKQIDFDGKFGFSNVIEVEADLTINDYRLFQNYPNPFNPSTTIKYSLPAEGNVKLSVFNTIGQELETLVSEYQSAGTYEILWNADQFTSGVYFYKFEVTGKDGALVNKEMKKLVLIK